MLRPALDGTIALFYIVFVCENAFFVEILNIYILRFIMLHGFTGF